MRSEAHPGFSPSIRASCLGVLAVLLAALPPGSALAQVDAQNFHPVADQKGYFHVSGSAPLDGGVLSGGAFFNYAMNPIQVEIEGQKVEVTKGIWTADFLLAYGILDWWDLAIDLPIAGIQNKEFAKDSSAVGIGDLRFETKLNPLAAKSFPVGASLRPYITIPTGDTENFLGADGVTFGVDLIVDKDLGFVQGAANVGYLYRQVDGSTGTGSNSQLGDAMTFGAGLRVPIEAIRLDLLAEVYGWSAFDGFLSAEETSPIEGLAGAVYHLEPLSLDITLGFGFGFNAGIGSPNFRIVAGISPSVVLGEKSAEEKKVRPPPPAIEAPAAVPAAPAPGAADSDGDGVADSEDLCPEDMGPAAAYGCPAEGARAPSSAPLPAIIGGRTLGTSGASRGAASEASFPPVYFETGSGKITQASYAILDRLIRALQASPSLKVKLEGHTDNQGNKQDNLALALRRAGYVKAYLVQPGRINPARIQINGLGGEFPIASNATPEGRARNRRVEIIVIEPSD